MRENDAIAIPNAEGIEVRVSSLGELPDHHLAQWRTLASSQPEVSAFNDPDWSRNHEAAFAPDQVICIAALVDDNLVGIVPGIEEMTRLLGVRTPVFKALNTDWLSRVEFVARSSDRVVVSAMWRFMLQSGRWSRIEMDLVSRDSITEKVGCEWAGRQGWKYCSDEGFSSPYRSLPDDSDLWGSDLKSKFRSNLRNRERRLSSRGNLRYSVWTAAEGLTAHFSEFLDLEDRGWKGAAGSSIARRPDARQFYTNLVKTEACNIWIPVLYLDAKPIAAQLIRVVDRTVFLLKVGFDPEFSAFSPGQLLMDRTARFAISRRMERFDFLGESMTWKLDWKPELLRHSNLRLFAPGVSGRLSYWATRGFRDSARHLLGKVHNAAGPVQETSATP